MLRQGEERWEEEDSKSCGGVGAEGESLALSRYLGGCDRTYPICFVVHGWAVEKRNGDEI